MTTVLKLTWGTSRAHDTYGHPRLTLRDPDTGKRVSCMGGGYDMVGTVFADWLVNTHHDRLLAIKAQARAHVVAVKDGPRDRSENKDGFYGMTWNITKDQVTIDGACGIESVRRIAEAVGLKVNVGRELIHVHEVNEPEDTERYRIVRMYADDRYLSTTVVTGLTKAEAVAHCQDPETSSSTATGAEQVARTTQFGNWFDGFELV